MSECIEIEERAGVLSIRMNRPDKKNAITRDMYAAMTAGLASAERDGGIAASLFLGVPGAFTAGNDIKDFLGHAKGGGGEEAFVFLKALAGASKPVLAAVDGLAIGIGTTMLMHCDLVFATPASRFRTPFLDLGLVPEAGSSLIAPRLMGHQRAFALLAMGETLDASAAQAANLVYRIVEPEAVEAEARAAAETLARKPPEALRIGRELMRGSREEILERIAVESRHFAERLRSEEARAAFEAFLSR